ncbi:amino acid adenylation domain-containing protein [Streptomyces sp. NBC_00525]|uniref:amino acid adenylation domain-containing protein n=1 Tax=Streptomyces sp. NBC_00525 TaxID=2903660 RepID=UPI002E7FB86D|nr:amino acid adenylation domain-containing protein [Streptomyces sp. NBC_00525]WUC95722.1 amino acid adenylation domain-containing protein [Streptomyces sp. NBC_00525]
MSIVPRRRRQRPADTAPTAPPSGQDRPLSAAQQHLWLMHRLHPDSSLYNIPLLLRLRGPLDVGVLQRGLRDIVARHDILRTRFPDRAGVPVQVVTEGAHLPLPVHDIAADADQEERLREVLDGETHAPFELAEEAPLRAAVVRCAAEEHVLALTFHHIVFDGSSAAVLLAELGELYSAHIEGRVPDLPELPLQYADFAERSRATDESGEQLRFWRERLAPLPPTLQLPADHSRPAVASHEGSVVGFEVGTDSVRRVEEFGRKAGVTPFVVFLSAFFALLGRYTGERDLAVGIPVVRRPAPDLDDLIGCFVNTLVIRVDVAPRLGFHDLVAATADAVYDAFDHMDVQFDEVVQAVQAERDPSYSPLVQASFGLQTTELTGELKLPGITVDTVADTQVSAKFDLSLDLVQQGEVFRGEIEYATDLFTAETAQRVAGHWVQLLGALLDDPDAPVAALPMLTADERERQLVTWNDTGLEIGDLLTMPELFDAQVARTPDALAVVKGADRLTYAELDRRANQLAHLLRDRGVRTETPVGVCMERGVDVVVAFLAVLKSGGVYVPLDPDYPSDRLDYMLGHAAVPVVVSTAATVREIPALAGALLLDEERTTLETMPGTAPEAGIDPDQLSCMFYTSGSTGTPKCAMVTHRNYANYFRFWEHTYLRDTPMRSHLQMTSFAFDIFIADAARALFSGAKLVIVPHDTVMSPPDLYALMVREEVNSAEFITPILAALADHLQEAGRRLDFLDLLVAGSDIWYSRDYLRICDLCRDDTQIVAAYGLSETAIDNATLARHEGPTSEDGIVPIGRPVSNTQLYVLNEWMQPQPCGVPGELFVGGVGVGRGYHRDGRRTASRYLPDPFSAVPGARLYRSGDLAKFRPDGVLEILGRIDNQVKVNGFRIELGEIESALRGHPAVDNAVVVVHTASGGDVRLVGYATLLEGEPEVDLTAYLTKWLPAYMIPSVIMVLDTLPLNANGKINRRALPAPSSADGAGAHYAPPRTPAERRLAEIWAEVLKVDRVGRHDNFFALGGSSLMLTQVASRIRRSLHREVPLRTIYQYPTVASLTAELTTRMDQVLERTIATVPRDAAPIPASPAQEQLWFLDQLNGGDVSYHVPTVLRLEGPLRPDALEEALRGLVARHEVLRTTFSWAEGGLRQNIAKDLRVPLERRDLSQLPAQQRDEALGMLIRADERAPFDLGRGPLIRTMLITLGEEEHVLLLTQHHIVTDGWSSEVLYKELGEFYAAAVQNHEPALPEQRLQYADFAVWQRDWLAGPDGLRQLAYWKDRLTGAPEMLNLPLDRERKAGTTDVDGASVLVPVPPDVHHGLLGTSRAHGVTLFMTLLASFGVLLARCTGQSDLVIGTPTAGRTRLELEPLLGFFVNTVGLRIDLDGDPAFAEVLDRVRETALGAYEHQDVPFDRVVQQIGPRRDARHHPLFQVMFALDDETGTEVALPGLKVEELHTAYSTAKFDLDLSVEHVDGELRAAFGYRTDVFDAATVEAIGAAWLQVLADAVRDPERRVSDFAPARPAGGVDAVQTPYADGDAVPDTVVLPVIGRMWARLLDMEPEDVAPQDDFFLLGGHSLLAMDLTLTLSDLLDLTLPVRALFEHPTLAEFTAEVCGRAREEGIDDLAERLSADGGDAGW